MKAKKIIGYMIPSFFKKIGKNIWIMVRHRGLECKIALSCSISTSTELEGMNRIYRNTTFHGRIGLGSYIGSNSYLSADIGRFTSIASFVRCNSGRHPMVAPFVSTSPCFYSLNKNKEQCGITFAQHQMFDEIVCYDEKRKISVKIGNDCWIGEGVFLVGGIVVNDGAVVLAHAVVTKDVPPYAIVGGVPAKIIKYRYDEDTIAFLKKTAWWNLPVSWLKDNWSLLCNIDEFKSNWNLEKK